MSSTTTPDTRGRSGRRKKVIAAASSVALATLGLVALSGPAVASVSTDASFEFADGNLTHESLTDWNDFAPASWTGTAPYQKASATFDGWTLTGLEDAQATTSDSAFAGGTKQDDQCATVKDAKAPNKDDLKRVYVTSKTVNDHIFLGLAWVRIPQNTTSPSAHIGFEFNQSQAPCPAGSNGLVERTPGDMLIVYDFEGGSTDTPTITLRRWLAADSTEPCEVGSNSPPCWGQSENLTTAGFAEAKVNTTTSVTDAIAPSAPDSLGVNEFGEAGIDLTAAGVFKSGVCTAFGKTYAVSRSSGNSATAQMKDLVGPGNIDIANCKATLATTPSTSSLEIGNSLTDTATITASGVSSPPAPTGSVDFYVCGPTSGINSCDSSGTKFDTVNLSGASQTGNDYSVTSKSFTPTSAGDYCFFATWPGDTSYTAGPYADGSKTECFTVTPKQPTISTSQTGKDGLPLGSTISDTATLGKTANQPDGSPAGGTITFYAYGPQASGNPSDTNYKADCTTTPAYTSTAYTVSGDGTYPTAAQAKAEFQPTKVGTYEWVAKYSGDSPNTKSVDSTCGDEPSVLYALQPSMDTAQFYYPQDSATVTAPSAGAGDVIGKVTFEAFENDSTCSKATPDYTETVDKTSNTGQTLTAKTDNSTYKVDGASTTVYWKVSFVSSNTGILNVTSDCTESSTVTISNGSTSSTP